MDHTRIYAIDFWRDAMGFDGTYFGPYLSLADAMSAAKKLCGDTGLTWDAQYMHSDEMLNDGSDYLVSISDLVLPYPFDHMLMGHIQRVKVGGDA